MTTPPRTWGRPYCLPKSLLPLLPSVQILLAFFSKEAKADQELGLEGDHSVGP